MVCLIWFVFTSELMAIKMVVEMAAVCGIQVILVATNSKVEVDYFYSFTIVLATWELMLDDMCLEKVLDSFTLAYVRQNANTVAHLLARDCPSRDDEQVFIDNRPRGALDLVDLYLI